MTRWLVTWATAEPFEAMAIGVALLAALVAVICAVKAWREEAEDWIGEGNVRP